MRDSYTGNVICHLALCDMTRNKKSVGCALVCPLSRENILVLDIFFEALNYEKIEQKKAYEIAGLLGKILEVSGSLRHKNMVDLAISTLSGPLPHISHCLFTTGALRFPLWTCESGWTHFHNLMFLQGQPGCASDEKLGLYGHLTILLRFLQEIVN